MNLRLLMGHPLCVYLQHSFVDGIGDIEVLSPGDAGQVGLSSSEHRGHSCCITNGNREGGREGVGDKGIERETETDRE